MMMRLKKYEVVVKYKQGNQMFLADTLSRHCIEDTQQSTEESDLQIICLEEINQKAQQTRRLKTEMDDVLYRQ